MEKYPRAEGAAAGAICCQALPLNSQVSARKLLLPPPNRTNRPRTSSCTIPWPQRVEGERVGVSCTHGCTLVWAEIASGSRAAAARLARVERASKEDACCMA